MTKPLRDIRVLDLTNVLSGPFCCHQLAHMGAQVIKVETPKGGDLARQLGADADLNQHGMGVSFLAQNAGKRSVTVNLKHAQGKDIFRRLVSTADVLVENFRPGVMERLGLGFEALRKINGTLVYCAISGFGQDGPLRDLPAYDQIIQGMAGVMSITGESSAGMYRVGYPVADTIGGMTAAFSIAATLAQKDRTQAVFLDVSMLEATLATMGWAVSNYLVADQEPVAAGNENVTASPSGAFQTAEGLLNIAANKQEQFEALCRVLGKDELMADPRFVHRTNRLKYRVDLKQELESVLSEKTAEQWWPLMTAQGIPAGPVYTVPQALQHPQIAQRGMIGHFAQVPGVERDIRVVRTGFKVDGVAPQVDFPPPELGQHTNEILEELGLSQHDIDTFRKDGAI